MGRMHDKYLIADGKTYILGGRNTYNYFLGDFPLSSDLNAKVERIISSFAFWIKRTLCKSASGFFSMITAHENVEIKLNNKANPLKPWKMMGRMHDKYLIADGKRYILVPISFQNTLTTG